MFPLFTDVLPKTAPELERRLNESLTRLFSGVDQPVAVTDRSYPELAELCITLDGAELRRDAPRPPRLPASGSTALAVDALRLSAREIAIGPARASLRLTAENVQLHEARDPSGEILLLLRSASDGEVEVSADVQEIENAIAAIATREAGKHSVTIDQVRLSATVADERSVDAEVQLRARKLFFSTTIRIGAKLELDEQLNARLSGLTCNGDGAIGALACGVLQPHLQELNGRSFPLMALPLGEIRLRDVRLAANGKITVHAEFGA